MIDKLIFNVKDFQAAGDSETYDTLAVQKAIDCASENNGIVFFPEGIYLIGTIYLKSNIELCFSEKAVLLGAPDICFYGDNTHYNRYKNELFLDKCLIYAEDCENICISGGRLDGNGYCFYEKGKEDIIHPMMFRFLRCRNIHIERTEIQMPAGWSVAFLECDFVYVNKAKILSRHFNGDGLDFDSCRNVFVSDCHMDTSDDCLCVQNSVIGRPSYNIFVRNCVMKSYWAAVRIGLLSNGDIENVIISDCIFEDVTCSGFKIQAAESGNIHNILVNNIVMKKVKRPLFITSNYCQMGKAELQDKDGRKGIDGLYFNNIVVDNSILEETDGTDGLFIIGTPERRIKNISLTNIYCKLRGGANFKVGGSVLELNENRPEYYNVGVNPAAGLYARHVDGLKMEKVEIELLQKDTRDKVIIDDVK